MSIVYVLRLDNNKYYVGRTNNLERRIEEHKNGYGSAWTKKYKFIELIKSFDADSPFYEDMIVKTMMHTHGIENVRGGSYSQVWLPKDKYMHLLHEMNGATDKCFKCGQDHFIKDCPNLNADDLGESLKDTIDFGWRIYASGVRKTQRLINYFWS